MGKNLVIYGSEKFWFCTPTPLCKLGYNFTFQTLRSFWPLIAWPPGQRQQQSPVFLSTTF